jgi:hypothetical protein
MKDAPVQPYPQNWCSWIVKPPRGFNERTAEQMNDKRDGPES